MRRWLLPALLALLALAPLAAAQADTFHLAAGTYRGIPIDVPADGSYVLDLSSDVPVDVALVNGTEDDYWAGTTGGFVVDRLNVTTVHAEGEFPTAGRWTLVIDDSGQPSGGANGTLNATVTVDLAIRVRDVSGTVVPTPPATSGSRNPWPVLMLTSPFWDLTVVGLGGMALWFLLLGALAAPGYKEGWSKVGVLTLGGGLIIALWALVPHHGPVWDLSIPLLLAVGIAWLAYRGATDGRQSLRMAFLGAGLAALLGEALGHLVQATWSDPGAMMLGTDRFDDPVFMMPVAAGLGALALAVIAAFVEASEEDEAAPAVPSPGITQSFTIQCLRCGTPIKVDRSMKRYRVATDRYEFACPNCHAWMEWAEPKPEGAAAA